MNSQILTDQKEEIFLLDEQNWRFLCQKTQEPSSSQYSLQSIATLTGTDYIQDKFTDQIRLLFYVIMSFVMAVVVGILIIFMITFLSPAVLKPSEYFGCLLFLNGLSLLGVFLVRSLIYFLKGAKRYSIKLYPHVLYKKLLRNGVVLKSPIEKIVNGYIFYSFTTPEGNIIRDRHYIGVSFATLRNVKEYKYLVILYLNPMIFTVL